uniref:Putative cleavage stimulating factor 64 n=1 Tax=Ambrosia artemisiifolia TaxID=4212 RepID=A0A4P8PIL7_AMBAR|nr:putative cleavage stimulating factor 64 [Ambrosia artemisiifolia]
MANSQHRCVFVGNIPYDATEEQLVQICEEVGPVVSFRLVIDRETGKPKGYGFCEYKDEETALSARRNLHGYDINGRQLRVDFAENDKNPDKSREQGRGGPGLPTNSAPQKQIGGPAVHSDPSLNQAVGVQVAMASAIVMAGTLGGGQTINNISQNGIQSQPTLGTDPLTLHLAKIPKGQLIEVLTELKALATQNKEQARQLLLAHPQLSKAILQAHIMLKAVPPHMLQMPNAQLLPGQHTHPPVHGGQTGQQSSMQSLSGLPPLAQNKLPLGFMQQSQSQPSSSLVPSQYAAPSLPPQPRFQTPLPAQHQTLHYSTLSGLSAAGNLQSLLPQHPIQPSLTSHKPSSSIGSSIPNNGSKDHEKPLHLSNNPAWGLKVDHHPSFNKDKDQIVHPAKLLKMDDGRGASFSPTDVNLPASAPLSGNHILKAGPTESQKPNPELPPGAESALLQQVLSLTPEQLSSLSPEQQQQVIQLQQMLRQSS